MKISISKSNSPNHGAHKYFDTVDVKTSSQFFNLIIKKHWSPIIWKGGERLTNNFIQTSLCVLDFDSGMTIGECANKLKEMGLFYIIGTTKNHMRLKHDEPACHRFRAVLKFKHEIKNADHYKQNMQHIGKMFPCDKAAFDGARKFAPCTKIALFSDGASLSVKRYVKPMPRYLPRDYFLNPRKVPDWIMEFFRCGIPKGGRNTTIYRIGKNLQKYGFTKDEVLSLINGSNIDLPKDEVEVVIGSAFR